MTTTNLERARAYLRALEARDGTALDHYAPDVRQIEHPNRLSPKGAERDLAALREAAERGRIAIAHETYTLESATSEGDRVALEVTWTGTLAIPLGTLQPGDVLRARFAVFLEYRDGRIVSQHNYDCFEPF